MKEQERDFKGIWIPREIWLTECLDIIEKCLLVEISSLCVNGYCYSSNEYFANFFQCSERKISASINKLIKMGLVEQVGFDGRKRYLQSRVENFARQKCTICDHNNTYNNYKENSKKETETKPTVTLQANDENQLSIESVGIETETNTCTTLTAHNEPSDYNKVVGYFEQTWLIYPRKESKIQARTTFTHKVFTKSQTESHKLALRIYKTLERQKVVWENENNGKGRDKQYIPLFSSWLNDNFEDVPKKDRGKI